MKRLAFLGAVLVAVTALPAPPSRAQTITCAAEVPAARKGHWYYRIIDGRKCWYEGKAMMPKSDLYWPKENVADTGTGTSDDKAAPAATDGRSVVPAPPPEPVAPAPMAAPPAWPSPVAREEISFEQRWLGLRLKN